jgi:hypothetical protein
MPENRPRSILPRGLGRGESQQAGGGPGRILTRNAVTRRNAATRRITAHVETGTPEEGADDTFVLYSGRGADR